MVHEVPVDECPFNMMLDREIEKAGYNVVNGLVDEVDFDDIRMGRTAGEVFGDLLRKRPTEEDLVFTHGDYCLPNVMIGARSGRIRRLGQSGSGGPLQGHLAGRQEPEAEHRRRPLLQGSLKPTGSRIRMLRRSLLHAPGRILVGPVSRRPSNARTSTTPSRSSTSCAYSTRRC